MSDLNRSNAYNVAIMYAGLKEHARDVEMALEDVKALLVKSNPSSWQAEFITLSQSVLRQDSGWE